MRTNRSQFPRYQVLAQTATSDCPVALHRRRDQYVITSCGRVLMTSGDTGSERALGRLAPQLLGGITRPRVLVGGLGMGFTLRATLDGLPRNALVVVAELLRPVVRWNRQHIGHLAKHPLTDSRVRVHVGDVADLLVPRYWDAILLDVDNGPEWIVLKRNLSLYEGRGLSRVIASLRPGGFLGVWSVGRHLPFERHIASMGFEARRFRPVVSPPGAGRPLIYVVQV